MKERVAFWTQKREIGVIHICVLVPRFLHCPYDSNEVKDFNLMADNMNNCLSIPNSKTACGV